MTQPGLFPDTPRKRSPAPRPKTKGELTNAIAEAIKRGFGKGAEKFTHLEWLRYQAVAKDLRLGNVTPEEVELRASRWKDHCDEKHYDVTPHGLGSRWSDMGEPTKAERGRKRRKAAERRKGAEDQAQAVLDKQSAENSQRAREYVASLTAEEFQAQAQAVMDSVTPWLRAVLAKDDPLARGQMIYAIYEAYKRRVPPGRRET